MRNKPNVPSYAIVTFRDGTRAALSVVQYCALDFSQVLEVRIVGAAAMGGAR